MSLLGEAECFLDKARVVYDWVIVLLFKGHYKVREAYD